MNIVGKNGQTYLITKLADMNRTAGYHNSIFRGKNLGEQITPAQIESITYGTFTDLYLGDYWTLTDPFGKQNKWMIVHFNYRLYRNHVIVMPMQPMYIPENTKLYGSNDTYKYFQGSSTYGAAVYEDATKKIWQVNVTPTGATCSTVGGYPNSRMRRVILRVADTIISEMFGNYAIMTDQLLDDARNDESAQHNAGTNGWAWFNNDDQSSIKRKGICELPSTIQLFGYPYGVYIGDSVSSVTMSNTLYGSQSLRFAAAQYPEFWEESTWTSTPANTSQVACYTVQPTGVICPNVSDAFNCIPVRPYFMLTGESPTTSYSTT